MVVGRASSIGAETLVGPSELPPRVSSCKNFDEFVAPGPLSSRGFAFPVAPSHRREEVRRPASHFRPLDIAGTMKLAGLSIEPVLDQLSP